MKQLKTMGYSAIILLILCLTSSNGFLEANRRIHEERNADDRIIDRNFFGNTWRRSSEIREERRQTPSTNRYLDERDIDNHRQIRDNRIIPAAKLFSENLRFIRTGALQQKNPNYRLITERLSSGRTTNQRQGTLQVAPVFEDESRSNDKFRRQSRQSTNVRENFRTSRHSDSSRVTERRNIRSTVERRQTDNSRQIRNIDNNLQIRDNVRTSRNSDSSRVTERRNIRATFLERRQRDDSRQIRNMDNNLQFRDNVRASRYSDSSRVTERRNIRSTSLERRQTDNSRQIRNMDNNIQRDSSRVTERRRVRSNSVERRQSDNNRQIHDIRDRRLPNSLQDQIREPEHRLVTRESRRLQVAEKSNDRGIISERQDVRNIPRDLLQQHRTTDRRQTREQEEQMAYRKTESRLDLNGNTRDKEAASQRRATRNKRELSGKLQHQFREKESAERRQDREQRQLVIITSEKDRTVRFTTLSRDRRVASEKRDVRYARRSLDNNLNRHLQRERISSEKTREFRAFNDRRKSLATRADVSRHQIKEQPREFHRFNDFNDRKLSVERQDIRSNSRRQFRHQTRDAREENRNIQEIRTLDRRLNREKERNVSNDRESRINQQNRLVNDAAYRSFKDENNNNRNIPSYLAGTLLQRDLRQLTIADSKIRTSLEDFETVEYIPEIKSNMLLNAIKVVLISFLVVQVVGNSSKRQNNWFCSLTNFVTVTKEKVL